MSKTTMMKVTATLIAVAGAVWFLNQVPMGQVRQAVATMTHPAFGVRHG
jgi:hypothetical protein